MYTIPNDLNTQDDALIDIKLPPIFKQTFAISSHQVKCKICGVTCLPKEIDILFHLTTCRGLLIGEKIQTTSKFNCLMCSFETKKFYDWKAHLFKPKHIYEQSCATKYSYDCNSCNTHFYGLQDLILKHQCKPKSLSVLSELMAHAVKSFDIQHKQMLYFCSDCKRYSYDINNLHMSKCDKALINSPTYVCESCLITFYDFCEKTFLNHKISSEHILMWCVNGKRNNLAKETTRSFPRLPRCISKYFEISRLLYLARCVVCCQIFVASYQTIYGHFNNCISSKEMSNIDNSTPLNSAHCGVCKYKYSTQDTNTYDNWVRHVKSLEHLNKISKHKQKLYSYYCSDSRTIFYGIEKFVNTQMLLTNNITGRSLFISKVMAEAYTNSNSCINYSVLFCCGICQNVKDDQSEKFCEHENIDSSQLFYCSTCLVKFNVQTDYTEHLLSSEHIVLKYFKPNETSELGYLEHSLKTIKESLQNLNESDDGNNECVSLSDLNSNYEEICDSLNSNDIEHQNVLDELHSSLHDTTEENMKVESKRKRKRKNDELLNISSTSCVVEVNDVLECMRKLSAQSQKSALNNYLRMKFELLNQMPHAINVFNESKLFFCTICDSIFCDQHDWTKHYTEIHDKIVNPLIFYCAICHIYHISTSVSISDHIQTIEHNVMVEFQESMKTNAIKPIKNDQDSFIPLDGIQVPKTEDEDETIQNSKKIKENHSIYIQIKDMDANLKKNNFSSLSKLIMKQYGNFTRIANNSNSFMILFEKMNQVNDIINHKEALEKQYGFKLQVFGENKQLSLKTKEQFTDWKTYKCTISNHLKVINSIDETKVKELCDSIRSFNVGTDSVHVHVLGSRLYKLPTEKSDVDLYLEIDDTFYGDIADDNDRQVGLIKMFAQQCYLKCDEFQNVEEICDARVPIIKFYHVPTKFNCDISFKSGLSVYKSELIKLYLSSNYDVKWLVCAVKFWALDNNLIDKSLFTSYALVWLVLFYLMTKNIIPPIIKLVKNASKDDQKIIEGWDCTFGKLLDHIDASNQRKLLLGFFQYYANKRHLKNHVLSTLTGKSMNKNKFFQDICKLPGLSDIQREKFKTFQSNVNSSLVKYYGLTIHDPFELSFNITRNINSDNLTDFCELCDQSETLLRDI